MIASRPNLNFSTHYSLLGWARTTYIHCIYGIFGRGITRHTVIYGAYTQFWPTLPVTHTTLHPCCTCTFCTHTTHCGTHTTCTFGAHTTCTFCTHTTHHSSRTCTFCTHTAHCGTHTTCTFGTHTTCTFCTHTSHHPSRTCTICTHIRAPMPPLSRSRRRPAG